MRSASNGEELVAVMTRELGWEIRTISGDDEADLVALSVRHNFDMSGKRYMIIDIGGGNGYELTKAHPVSMASLSNNSPTIPVLTGKQSANL